MNENMIKKIEEHHKEMQKYDPLMNSLSMTFWRLTALTLILGAIINIQEADLVRIGLFIFLYLTLLFSLWMFDYRLFKRKTLPEMQKYDPLIYDPLMKRLSRTFWQITALTLIIGAIVNIQEADLVRKGLFIFQYLIGLILLWMFEYWLFKRKTRTEDSSAQSPS